MLSNRERLAVGFFSFFLKIFFPFIKVSKCIKGDRVEGG